MSQDFRPLSPEDPEFARTHIVEAYSAANAIEAGAVRAALDEAGIRCEISNLLLNNGGAELVGWRAAPKILVREEDLPATRAVIEQYHIDRKQPIPDESWDVGEEE